MNKKAMMPKNTALERIESHEKLCRIMQKQTHQKIHNIETEIKDIKKTSVLCYVSSYRWYVYYYSY
ncbi:hypothetical protein, partial [uncultured phage MedDCM-OCT-S08-C233]